MKSNLFILILSLSSTIGFSQETSYNHLTDYTPGVKKEKATTGTSRELSYEIHGAYIRTVTKEKLKASRSLSEIIPGYPSNWFTDFVTAEIQSTCNGKTMKAVSLKDILSSDQKFILNNADLGTDIGINVSYQYTNPVTEIITTRNMNVSLTVVPEIEAEFNGGYEQLQKYLKKNAITQLSEINSDELLMAIVRFTIDEKGEITNAQISKTSGYPKIDKLLIEVINAMPKWLPAENSQGIKVKQDIEFRVGSRGC